MRELSNYLNQYGKQYLKLHLQQLGSIVTTEEKSNYSNGCKMGWETWKSIQASRVHLYSFDSNSVTGIFICKTYCALLFLSHSFYFRKYFCSMINTNLVEALYLIPRWGITHLDFIFLHKFCVFTVLCVHTHRYCVYMCCQQYPNLSCN